MRFASGRERAPARVWSWLDPCHCPAGSRVGSEHPARADKPCGEPGYISSGLALNSRNHVAQGWLGAAVE